MPNHHTSATRTAPEAAPGVVFGTPSALASCGCPGDLSLAVSRRNLLRGATAVSTAALGAAALGSTTVFATASPAAAEDSAVITAQRAARPGPAARVLVVLSMRGAADGLSLVVPHADPAYAASRPVTKVPTASLIAANNRLGLHPNFKPLLPLWNAGRMAAIPAVGLPAPNRSHFSAMEEIEDADPGSSARIGWLNRLLGRNDSSATAAANASPLSGMSVASGPIPTSLLGPRPTLSLAGADRVNIAAADKWDVNKRRPVALHSMWDTTPGPLGRAARAAMAAYDDWQPVRDTPPGSGYPDNPFGRALADVARILKADIGTEAITVDYGSWDTHIDAGTLDWGSTRTLVDTFARSVAAFFADIDATPGLASKVTVVTISEFGRRVQENASRGTDHGWGTASFLFGAGVVGGYHGTMPALENTVEADVAVTTDFRSVLSEVVTTCFDTTPAKIFPGFSPQTVGAMRRT